MISAKLIALCLCPVIAAPMLLTVSPAARHQTAHSLHRIAKRLSPETSAERIKPEPCAPLTTGAIAPTISPETLPAPKPAAAATITAQITPINWPFTPATPIPQADFDDLQTFTPPQVSVSGAPDPELWVLMFAGFAVSGMVLRWRKSNGTPTRRTATPLPPEPAESIIAHCGKFME